MATVNMQESNDRYICAIDTDGERHIRIDIPRQLPSVVQRKQLLEDGVSIIYRVGSVSVKCPCTGPQACAQFPDLGPPGTLRAISITVPDDEVKDAVSGCSRAITISAAKRACNVRHGRSGDGFRLGCNTVPGR
jgi:hypothetical protein